MLGEIFYWIFNMSIAATICVMPLLLLRLIKKIPRRIFIWLWLVPFIRMCIPVGISSKYGIMALLSYFYGLITYRHIYTQYIRDENRAF